MRYVAYYRVSTQAQGRSGLGLEAQRSAVLAFIGSNTLVAEFTEVESGRKDNRQQLTKALEACRLHKATLAIAKLDRLARNAAFLLNLRDSGIEFVACDMPNANRLTVGIMALVAEEEARAISARTKAALGAARARGVRLGNPGTSGYTPPSEADRERAAEAKRTKAKNEAAPVLAAVAELRAEGITSASAIARALNERGITTPRGGQWQTTQVTRLLALA